MNMEEEFENVRSFLTAGELALRIAADCDDLQKAARENFGDLYYSMSSLPEYLVLRANLTKAIIIAGYFAHSAQLSTKKEIEIHNILCNIANGLIKNSKSVREFETCAIKNAIKAFDSQKRNDIID